jgi:predicted ATPase
LRPASTDDRARGVGDRSPLRNGTPAALRIDAVLDELLGAELIDQVRSIPTAEYAFHHPLIRAVAYESQLRSDRADLHGRVAAAIESCDRRRPTRMPP